MTEDRRADALAVRATARRDRSTSSTAAIRTRARQQRALPERSLGAHMLGRFPGLTRFFDDPRLAVHDGATERGLRGMVLGCTHHDGKRDHRYRRRESRAGSSPPCALVVRHNLLDTSVVRAVVRGERNSGRRGC
jgi:hypothetical protein